MLQKQAIHSLLKQSLYMKKNEFPHKKQQKHKKFTQSPCLFGAWWPLQFWRFANFSSKINTSAAQKVVGRRDYPGFIPGHT